MKCIAILCLVLATATLLKADACGSGCETAFCSALSICVDIPNVVDCASLKTECTKQCTDTCNCNNECAGKCTSRHVTCTGAADDTFRRLTCDAEYSECQVACAGSCNTGLMKNVLAEIIQKVSGATKEFFNPEAMMKLIQGSQARRR